MASSHLLTCPLLLLAEKSGTASLLGLDFNKDRPLLPSSGLKNMKLQSLPPVLKELDPEEKREGETEQNSRVVLQC